MKVKLLKKSRKRVKVYERNGYMSIYVNNKCIYADLSISWRKFYCNEVVKVARKIYGLKPKNRII